MRGELAKLPNPRSWAGSSSCDQDQFSLDTPIVSLLNIPLSKEAVAVGARSPPMPSKLAGKIWRGEYIELDELLLARLGPPAPTVLDVLLHRDKAKPKKNTSTIQDWYFHSTRLSVW